MRQVHAWNVALAAACRAEKARHVRNTLCALLILHIPRLRFLKPLPPARHSTLSLITSLITSLIPPHVSSAGVEFLRRYSLLQSQLPRPAASPRIPSPLGSKPVGLDGSPASPLPTRGTIRSLLATVYFLVDPSGSGTYLGVRLLSSSPSRQHQAMITIARQTPW